MNGGIYFPTQELAFIGQGRRRICYAVRGTGRCVKFYRKHSELAPGTKWRIRLDIMIGRYLWFANINYREWRYHCKLARRLPKDVMAVFPEHVQLVFSKEKGWGVVETLIRNADGSLSRTVIDEMTLADDPVLARRVYHETERLFRQLAEYGVCFFDPRGNVLVQWIAPSVFRLRIADLEPYCRAGIPGLANIRLYVQCKIRRRAARYLSRLMTIMAERGLLEAECHTQPHRRDNTVFLRMARCAGFLW
ncbi:MAG: hypothetical protein PHG96_14150 [Kiritimatiellae bacterium]|nr:hypothetical protein [Kiritimatiellia bacterium]MDD4026540.1 hypothetical protein [Kiritimatiellia bacterium]MDD4623748.1 hypothetical protein [Kiritimatiellia bacterium]